MNTENGGSYLSPFSVFIVFALSGAQQQKKNLEQQNVIPEAQKSKLAAGCEKKNFDHKILNLEQHNEKAKLTFREENKNVYRPFNITYIAHSEQGHCYFNKNSILNHPTGPTMMKPSLAFASLSNPLTDSANSNVYLQLAILRSGDSQTSKKW